MVKAPSIIIFYSGGSSLMISNAQYLYLEIPKFKPSAADRMPVKKVRTVNQRTNQRKEESEDYAKYHMCANVPETQDGSSWAVGDSVLMTCCIVFCGGEENKAAFLTSAPHHQPWHSPLAPFRSSDFFHS